MAPSPSFPDFDSFFALTAVSSTPERCVYRRITPEEMSFGAPAIGPGKMYGGYLNALTAKAILNTVQPRGFPHIMTLTADIIATVAMGEEVEIDVEIIRSTRRLCFVRATARSATSHSALVLAQSVCGHLSSPSPSGDASPTSGTRLSPRYDFSHLRHLAPTPQTGVPDVITKVTGQPRPDHLARSQRIVRTLHAESVLKVMKDRFKKGPEEVRKERWEETLDTVPFIICHPSGRSVDQLSATLFCDTIPLSAVLRREIGPLIPSVTSSLSLQFYKPFPPDTPFMYTMSGQPAADVPVSVLPGHADPGHEKPATGNVEYWDSIIWTPAGEVVGFQRQARTVVGGETKAYYEQVAGEKWPMSRLGQTRGKKQAKL